MGELGQSDKEGEAERRRELEEEEMAQAGKPEKLEEDLDQTQQEEEEEPEPPDENTADQKRGRSQQVRYPWTLWTETRTSKKKGTPCLQPMEQKGVCLNHPLLVRYSMGETLVDTVESFWGLQ